MKMTNMVLVNLINTLGSYSTYKLPQKISYAITKNIMTIQKEYNVYEQQMKKIFEDFDQYTLKDENDNPLFEENGLPKIQQEHQDEFIKEMNELLKIEVDIALYYVDSTVFDYEDSPRFDPLTPNDIMMLQSILCKQE